MRAYGGVYDGIGIEQHSMMIYRAYNYKASGSDRDERTGRYKSALVFSAGEPALPLPLPLSVVALLVL